MMISGGSEEQNDKDRAMTHFGTGISPLLAK